MLLSLLIEPGPQSSGMREPLVPKPSPPALHMSREPKED